MNGYDALRNSAAWIDLSSRGKIRVLGEDRARLLHAMTTNHVQQMKPGDTCYAYFLSAQGRILADVNILCREDDFLLDTEPEVREKVYEHLDKFIIADDVTLEDVTEQLATIAVEGPKSTELAPGFPDAVPFSFTGQPGFFLFVPIADREAVIAKLERAGAVEADAEAARIVRIENGKPRYGEDLSERYLSQEANQPHALHFNKGCYLGQEIVERVRSRAQIHRRLLPFELDTDQLPAPGTKLQSDGKVAAEVTSAVYSPARLKTVGLAYVRIDFKPGDRIQSGEVSGTVLPEPARSIPESPAHH